MNATFTGRKRRSPAALICAVLLLFSAAGDGLAFTLRIATFNVEWGLGIAGGADFENTTAILQRIGPDVVGIQELENDSRNLASLGTRLNLPYRIYGNYSSLQVGLLSRYPIAQHHWIYQSGMTRAILLAQINVPGALRKPWVAVVHLKCCNTYGTEQYTRAVELYHLRQALRLRTLPEDPVVLMGDFNLVSPTDRIYDTGPDGTGPYTATADADGYFVDEGIYKLDVRHAGTSGENWTWRSNGVFPNGALDHIMVNATVRARGTASEIYHAGKDSSGVAGLPKYGNPLTSSYLYVSDHLPVFADLDVQESGILPAQLAVGSLEGEFAAEGPLGGPFSPGSGDYVLSNLGAEPLQWAAEDTAEWLAISPSSGSLAPGESAVVTASVTTAAANLPPGNHAATLRFFNHTNGLGASQWQASLFAAPFVMDGMADAAGYTISGQGVTLRAAVRGTRLYVATSAPPDASANDHHVFISDRLLPSATDPAVWAKRGFTAHPGTAPYLAAEGGSKWSGWFNAPASTRLYRSPQAGGVLEGSIDLVESFGTVPEFVYIAAIAYETSDSSPTDTSAGRVVGQVPAAVVADDNITPDEFFRIPVRSITDSAADGRFDALVPERGFAAELLADGSGVSGVRWKSTPGRSYRVWRSEDLVAGTWENIGTKTAGPHDWQAEWPDDPQTGITPKALFYRVELIDMAN